MFIRRAAAWISTVMVAIVVALAVPVSQLRTISIIKTCCCPDPAHCHCPDHQAGSSSQPSMRACHKTEHAVVSPEAPALRAPAVVAVIVPAVTHLVPDHMIPAPHPAPPPARPDAPS